MFDIKDTNDIVLLLWMCVALFMGQSATKKKVKVLGQEEERYSLIFAVVVFFPLFWFVTTVYARSDMYAYQRGFNSFSMSIADVISNWGSFDKGPGWALVSAFSKTIGMSTFEHFRVLICLLQGVPILLIYRKYSEDYVYSMFLFVANAYYDSWMMNGMRQFLAACIAFCAFPLMIRKKYVFSLLIILVAMTVHSSAIVMIPVFIISQLKPWSKFTIVALIGFAVLLYYYVGHSDWMSEESLQEAQGSSPLRILLSSIPVVIAFVGRKQIALAGNRMINMCVNISIMTMLIFAVASVTSGIMTGRLPGYTSIYTFLFYPFLINKVFNEKISKNIKTAITILYVVYFILDLYLI